MPLSLLTLNVSSPTPQRAEALLAYLWHRPEQVLVLTEFGAGKGSTLIAGVCRAAGYDVVSTLAPGPPAGGADPDRLGVLVVGRGVAIRPVSTPRPTLLPHRVATVRVEPPEVGAAPVRVAGVYGAASDPVRYAGAAQRRRKRDWLVAFEAWLPAWLSDEGQPACPDGSPPPAVVLLGDLNIVSPTDRNELRYVLSEERAAYRFLLDAGLTDAYRAAHPVHDPAATQASWVDHSGAGCRYDHAFVRDARIVRCDLDQAPRRTAVTDHAALALTIEPQQNGPGDGQPAGRVLPTGVIQVRSDMHRSAPPRPAGGGQA